MSDILDGDEDEYMSTYFSEVCFGCVHWDESDYVIHRCKAFPDGIPLDIWLGKNNHQSPYPGDHGIQFTPSKK